MCGIAGVLKIHTPGDDVPTHHDAIPERWLDTLDDAIKHRGPDGKGRFRDRAVRADGTVVDVALVHRRLSIIDHADGAQPMVHRRKPDGTGELLRPAHGVIDLAQNDADHAMADVVAACFNGCIYNHRELRSELEALGHRFCTDHSDTEVLIHGWRAWGLRMLEELDGMYATLIWDRRTGQLAWARDEAGEKPLWLARRDGTTCFCSVPAPLDHLMPPQHHARATTAINALRGDSCGPVCGHGIWAVLPHPPRVGANDPLDWRPADRTDPLERFSLVGDRTTAGRQLTPASAIELLRHAIISRLEADVPLGVFLSGGLDSALIAAIAHKAWPDIKAFTVRMPVAEYDESQDAAETAVAIGIDHVILDCEPESNTGPARDLVHLIEQLGLPFGDSSLLPTYWVSKAAHEHVKVALSGDGGDELFGGYRRHTINTALTRWRRVLKLIPDALLDQRKPASRSTYLARLTVAARHEGYRELLSIFPAPDFRRLVTFDGKPPEVGGFQQIDDPLRHDFHRYLPDDLLRKTDTASMAVALEVRAPFLARDLVEAALRTPLDVLMPNGERKGLLKRVAREHLPGHVINRPKRGFAIPIGDWFRTDWGGMRTLLYDHLDPPGGGDPFPVVAEAGVAISMPFVRQLLREHDLAGERSLFPWKGRDHSQRLYLLLVLSIWCRWLLAIRQNVSEGPGTPRGSL
ncbi:MAG: asparagine synthase (glutamine-hydrolyzing) [Planctomycetota bacterium]